MHSLVLFYAGASRIRLRLPRRGSALSLLILLVLLFATLALAGIAALAPATSGASLVAPVCVVCLLAGVVGLTGSDAASSLTLPVGFPGQSTVFAIDRVSLAFVPAVAIAGAAASLLAPDTRRVAALVASVLLVLCAGDACLLVLGTGLAALVIRPATVPVCALGLAASIAGLLPHGGFLGQDSLAALRTGGGGGARGGRGPGGAGGGRGPRRPQAWSPAARCRRCWDCSFWCGCCSI